MRDIRRRTFLISLAGSIGLLASARGVVALLAPHEDASSAADALLSGRFGSSPATRRIGRAYLAAVPSESDPRTLRSALSPSGQDPDEWWGTIDVESLSATVRTDVRQDFAIGQTWTMDGWVLSRTEGRLAALLIVG